MVVAAKPTEFGKIMQYNNHYAVQGHLRSPSSHQSKAHMPLTISEQLKSYILPGTISKLFWIISPIFTVDMGAFHHMLVWGEPLNSEL